MHDIENRPRSSFLVEGKNSPLVPALFIGGAFVAGVCLMGWINRDEFGMIVNQFEALWLVAKDRQEMLRFGVQLLITGVIFAAIALACCLTVYASKGDRREEREETRAVETASAKLPSLQAAIVAGEPSPPKTSEWEAQKSVPQQNPVAQNEAPQSESRAAVFKVRTINVQLPPLLTAHEIQGSTYGDTMVISEAAMEQEIKQQVKEKSGSGAKLIADGEGQPQVSITITLLKTVTMTLHVPTSNKAYPIPLDDLNSKALQLIAYIAWRQGKKVNLGEMRNDVFGNDEMDLNQVQESLNTAKREIRRRIHQTVDQIKSELGKDALPENLDIFELAKKKYWLPAHCQVTDLGFLEEQHRMIEQAETDNLLVNAVPEQVYHACTALIQAYSGDFLEDLLTDDPYSFDPPADSWAREPFTLYRDYYLDAILYAAEYERKQGDGAEEQNVQREHYAEAARLFALGAMAACNKKIFDGRFDTKVSFSSKPGRRHGAHVLLSEQLMRRAIALYGQIGSTIVAKRIYSTYEQQMLYVSNKAWSADGQTLKDLEAALQHTGAYRFPDTIASPYDLSNNVIDAESA